MGRSGRLIEKRADSLLTASDRSAVDQLIDREDGADAFDIDTDLSVSTTATRARSAKCASFDSTIVLTRCGRAPASGEHRNRIAAIAGLDRGGPNRVRSTARFAMCIAAVNVTAISTVHFGLLTAFIMLVAMAAALVLAPVVPSSTRVMRRWSASAIVEGSPERPVILGGHRGRRFRATETTGRAGARRPWDAPDGGTA